MKLSRPTRSILSGLPGPVIGSPVEDTRVDWYGIIPGHSTRTENGMLFWNPIRGRHMSIKPHAATLETVGVFRDALGPNGGTPGTLYRSAKLTGLNISDRLTLSGILGDNGVILDLRTPGRAKTDPDPKLPSVENVHIALPPTAYVPYADLVLRNKGTLRRIMSEIAFSPGPVLVHCTEGKDRTGIVVALVMFALGASEQAAQREYMRTPGADIAQWNRMVRAMAWEIGRPVPQNWIEHPQGLHLPSSTIERLRERMGVLK